MHRLAVALFVLLAGAFSAAAQTVVSTDPPLPAGSTPITLILFNSCGCPGYSAEEIGPPAINGFTIDIPHSTGCLSACFPQETRFPIGVLPPGTYTVRHYLSDRTPASGSVIGTFVVAAAAAPVPLGTPALLALAVTLALTAAIVLRR